MDTNVISYTLTAETAGSCSFADPVPGCSPHFEKEQLRALADLERGLNASTADWKVMVDGKSMIAESCSGKKVGTGMVRSRHGQKGVSGFARRGRPIDSQCDAS